MWNNYNIELSVIFDNLRIKILSYLQEVTKECRKFKLSFCGALPNYGLSSIHWLIMDFLLLISHFAHGCRILIQSSNYKEFKDWSSS